MTDVLVWVKLRDVDGNDVWQKGPFTITDKDEEVTIRLEDVEAVEGGFLFPVVRESV